MKEYQQNGSQIPTNTNNINKYQVTSTTIFSLQNGSQVAPPLLHRRGSRRAFGRVEAKAGTAVAAQRGGTAPLTQGVGLGSRGGATGPPML